MFVEKRIIDNTHLHFRSWQFNNMPPSLLFLITDCLGSKLSLLKSNLGIWIMDRHRLHNSSAFSSIAEHITLDSLRRYFAWASTQRQNQKVSLTTGMNQSSVCPAKSVASIWLQSSNRKTLRLKKKKSKCGRFSTSEVKHLSCLNQRVRYLSC